ncbi:MAG: DUF4783 domain-containing protein [Bacteroidetes bacterium]|nr:DUF4783 domain-containing protein [Bacteroidota bacterium]
MKKIILILSCAFLISQGSYAQQGNEIAKSLNQGNADAFASYFDGFVDLKLPERDEIKNVGKNQATITIKSFFTDEGIKGFDKTSERELSGTKYMTGKLMGKNKNYNITIMMKKSGDDFTIITVRIN